MGEAGIAGDLELGVVVAVRRRAGRPVLELIELVLGRPQRHLVEVLGDEREARRLRAGDADLCTLQRSLPVVGYHQPAGERLVSLVDERGRAQDGFLRLDDLYDLELDADLVVLSACQSALGKEVRGEGLVGLTRGFHYAGAPRVVASLWNVRDEATAELMQRFYRGMLRDRLRPAAALRQAQVSMWRQQRWTAPYTWAGFVLQGEWR